MEGLKIEFIIYIIAFFSVTILLFFLFLLFYEMYTSEKKYQLLENKLYDNCKDFICADIFHKEIILHVQKLEENNEVDLYNKLTH